MGKSISTKYKVAGSVKTALFFLMVFAFSKNWGQTTIFSENMGNPGTTTAIGSNAFQNGSPIAFSGTGDVRTTTPSSGYTGSSGGGNVFLTNSASKTFQICGINTSTCSSLVLTFGVNKSVAASPNTELQLQFSSDGGATFGSAITVTITGGAVWSLQTISSGIPSAANICIKFTNISTTAQFRIDDVKLTGTCSSSHTVTFNANTGTGSMSAQTASTTTNLTGNAFTKAGCTFTGWNTAANGSGTAYSDGQAYSFAADMTLYAQWSCPGSTNTVTFNANGGTGSMSAQTASTTTNLTGNAFTRSGCTFTGWNTAANGSGTAYSDGQAYNFAADMTLYAQWNCGSTCPYLVSAVVNACAGSCSGEGNNEFLVMNSGTYSIAVNSTNINLVYNNGSDNYFTESFAAQPGVISNLNSLAGCGTLFVDASTGTIPPNSTFFVMNQGSCFNNGSFSAYCGLGTIYVAFSTDATWGSGGFFTNNNNPRYFKTDFSSVNGGCGVTTYSYNNSNEFSFGADGASVVFSGTTPSYVTGNGSCVPPVTILPISLVDFFATANGDKNDIVWKVASEEGIRNYIIEKSEDGINFVEHARIAPAGSEGKYATYSTEDFSPYKEITYYRLSTIEDDYSYKRYDIIDVDRNSKDWKTLVYQHEQDIVLEFKNTVPKNSSADLFDLTGKLLISKPIDQQHVKINTNELATGIYFIRITTAYKTENLKIVIQK